MADLLPLPWLAGLVQCRVVSKGALAEANIPEGKVGVGRAGVGRGRQPNATNNDLCITMGSDESDTNISLTVRDKVIKDSVHTLQLMMEKKMESRTGIELRSFCLPA